MDPSKLDFVVAVVLHQHNFGSYRPNFQPKNYDKYIINKHKTKNFRADPQKCNTSV